jgi:hypothetical protein
MHVNNSSSLRVRLCPSLYDINDEGFHVCRRRNISSQYLPNGAQRAKHYCPYAHTSIPRASDVTVVTRDARILSRAI